jgi:hypothetical protein
MDALRLGGVGEHEREWHQALPAGLRIDPPPQPLLVADILDRVRLRADQVHGVLVRVRCQQPAPLPVPAQLVHQVVGVLGTAVDLQQHHRHPGRRRPHDQVRPLDVPVAEPVRDLGLEAEPVPDPGAVQLGGRGGDRCGVVVVAAREQLAGDRVVLLLAQRGDPYVLRLQQLLRFAVSSVGEHPYLPLVVLNRFDPHHGSSAVLATGCSWWWGGLIPPCTFYRLGFRLACDADLEKPAGRDLIVINAVLCR